MIPTIIQIGEILVSSEIITEKFVCDYQVCRGQCCISGESGAPMDEEDAERIEKNYDSFSAKMTPEARKKVSEVGFFEIDTDGDMVTPLLGNSEECVYSRFVDGACFCACEPIKPISCRLYPIRVSTLSSGMKALNLHRWDICSCAFAEGKKKGIPVYVFLRDPIITAFGEEFYEALCAATKALQNKGD